MTLVDVCSRCGTLFEAGEDHCRRCGTDREACSEKRELRDLCLTYGEQGEVTSSEVKPIFHPKWGQVQWYERPEEERGGRRKRGD